MEALQTTALLEDVPGEGLIRGQVGAVVEALDAETYEVEFVDASGHTYGLTTLKRRQIIPLVHSETKAA